MNEPKYVQLVCTRCGETYVTKAVAKGTSKYCFTCKDELMDERSRSNLRRWNGRTSAKRDA